jgi:O-antigen ligase
MLFWDKKGRGLFVVGGMAAVTILFMAKYGDTSAFDERMKQTVEGNSSDEYRVAIIKSCINIALENPVIGVSPQRLPWELGRVTKVPGAHVTNFLDSHNVFGHVAAASGLICFAAMIGIGLTMSFIKLGDGKHPVPKNDPMREARKLMRMMVILWAFRGMFTREILYNPACAIGLGLAIGLFILAQTRFKEQVAAQGPLPRAGGRPLPAM